MRNPLKPALLTLLVSILRSPCSRRKARLPHLRIHRRRPDETARELPPVGLSHDRFRHELQPGLMSMDHHMFDNVFVNPEAYQSFLQNEMWADKTMMVLAVRRAEGKGSINQKGNFQGTEVMGLKVHVKVRRAFRGSGPSSVSTTIKRPRGLPPQRVATVATRARSGRHHLRSVLPHAVTAGEIERNLERRLPERNRSSSGTKVANKPALRVRVKRLPRWRNMAAMPYSKFSRRSFLALSAALPWALRGVASGLAPSRKIPVGLELYSVRDELQKDPQGTVRAVAKMGYQDVEFYAPYLEWSEAQAKDMRKLIDELQIHCYSTHNDEDFFSDSKIQKARELNKILGSRYMVLAWSDPKPNLDGWKNCRGESQ